MPPSHKPIVHELAVSGNGSTVPPPESPQAAAVQRRSLMDSVTKFGGKVAAHRRFSLRERLRQRLTSRRFELITARQASASLRGHGGDVARVGVDAERLTIDALDNFDGLERLIVIAVDLDVPLDRDGGERRPPEPPSRVQ